MPSMCDDLGLSPVPEGGNEEQNQEILGREGAPSLAMKSKEIGLMLDCIGLRGLDWFLVPALLPAL